MKPVLPMLLCGSLLAAPPMPPAGPVMLGPYLPASPKTNAPRLSWSPSPSFATNDENLFYRVVGSLDLRNWKTVGETFECSLEVPPFVTTNNFSVFFGVALARD